MAFKRVTVSLPEDRYERVKDLSNEMCMSVSETINWIIKSWDSQLSSEVSDAYANYGELRGRIEYLRKHYDDEYAKNDERARESRESGEDWKSGYYCGLREGCCRASAQMVLLLK